MLKYGNYYETWEERDQMDRSKQFNYIYIKNAYV
jgi:hypothetical protein